MPVSTGMSFCGKWMCELALSHIIPSPVIYYMQISASKYQPRQHAPWHVVHVLLCITWHKLVSQHAHAGVFLPCSISYKLQRPHHISQSGSYQVCIWCQMAPPVRTSKIGSYCPKGFEVVSLCKLCFVRGLMTITEGFHTMLHQLWAWEWMGLAEHSLVWAKSLKEQKEQTLKHLVPLEVAAFMLLVFSHCCHLTKLDKRLPLNPGVSALSFPKLFG